MASAAPEATARKSVGLGAGETVDVFVVPEGLTDVRGATADVFGTGAEARGDIAGSAPASGPLDGSAMSRAREPTISRTVNPKTHRPKRVRNAFTLRRFMIAT